MKISIRFLLIFSLLLSQGAAASYYVDYVGGSNSSAGTSTGAAWKHCPGDPSATSNPASATLAAGDTVFFKGGVTYVLTGSTGIILSWNGSSGSPITYDGNSAGSWGTGQAVITDNNKSTGLFAMRATSSDLRYVTFKNLKFYKCGGSASLPSDPGSAISANSGAGIYANGKMTNVTADGCSFVELGYWYNQKPMGAGSIVGAGFEFDGGCSGVTINNCLFSRTAIGIEAQWRDTGGIDGLTITNCTFTDSLVWCIDLPPQSTSSTMTNVSIHDNLFTNYQQFDDPNWSGYGDWPHTDGIFLRSDHFGCTWGTINIWNNVFSSNTATAGGTASIYITEGPSANIYNNRFIHQGKTRAIDFANGQQPGASAQVVRIINNTFLSDFVTHINWGHGDPASPVGSGTGSSILIENNVFVDLQSASGANFIVFSTDTASASGFFYDYNIYRSGNTSGAFFKSDLTGEAGLSQIRSTSPWEDNGISANPLFVTSIAAGSDPTTANLHLQSGSPARGVGLNFTSLVSTLTGLGTDCAGNARPTSGAWDLGAYQDSTASSPVILLNYRKPRTLAGAGN